MYSRCLLLSLPAAPLTFPPHNKRAPLNALYGVVVGVLESCHLIRSENFAFPQSMLKIYISTFCLTRSGARCSLMGYIFQAICDPLFCRDGITVNALEDDKSMRCKHGVEWYFRRARSSGWRKPPDSS